jgi:hypothetical protein
MLAGVERGAANEDVGGMKSLKTANREIDVPR